MKKTGIPYAVALVIGVAVLCRMIPLTADNPLLDKMAVLARDYIYIGLFFAWGISVKRRLMQPQARRMLLTVAVLIVGWLLCREFKFRFVMNTDVSRYLWYLYYIPLLLIPLLALYVSVSLGKPETYRLPKQMALFCFPTVVLISLVLTNDLHGFAFHFTQGFRDEFHYTYGWLYYVVYGWIVLCSLLSFIVMATKLRIPQGRKFLWLPLIPFSFAVLYGFLYYSRVPFVFNVLGDLTVVLCLLFVGYFEACIQCGLIPSNTRYLDLFYAAEGVSLLITDKAYHVCYTSSAAAPLKEEDMRLAEQAPVVLQKQMQIRNLPIDGGHAVWTEDIAPLLSLQETLEMRREELSERNAFLQLEYEKEKSHKTIEEQNRLYDLLQRKTQTQLDQMEALIQRYQAAEDEQEKRRILGNIIVFGSFIKRRKNFILSAEEEALMPEAMLSSALNESFRALRNLDIQGSYYVDCGGEYQKSDGLILAYDFFEAVIEQVLNEAHYLNVRVCRVNGALRINMLADCRGDYRALKAPFPSVSIDDDEDGTAFVLPLTGGETP